MQPLTPRAAAGAVCSSATARGPAPNVPRRRDPAPSRLAYRLTRLWLTPLVRMTLRVGLPAFALVFGAGLLLSDEARRTAVVDALVQLHDAIEQRPEFQVAGMEVRGASAPVETALRALGPIAFPVSSFRLDLDALRQRFEALDAVAQADLVIRPDGILDVRVRERVPAVVWRGRDGLALLDDTGHRIARLTRPEAGGALPLIAGDGAERHVPEALTLIAATAPIGEDLVGLVRVGERRWDVVLRDDRRIQLPHAGALGALERVLALQDARELLDRDVQVVDMRLPTRPTLRLGPEGLGDFRRIRAFEQGVAER